MDSRAAELLASIEDDLSGSDVPTSTILQKCILLGGRAGSDTLRSWASRELNGYENDDDLPSYRKVGAVILMDIIAGNRYYSATPISSAQLPKVDGFDRVDETVHLTQALGELEALGSAEGESLKFTKPIAPLVAAEFDKRAGQPFQQVQALYWSLSRATILGVVSRVRTALVELVSELVTKSPSPSELPPSDAIGHAVQLIINGERPVINLSAVVGGSGSSALTSTHMGDTQVGDTFSNISNSNIVNRSLVSNSLNALEKDGKTEEAEALRALAEEVEKSGNKEAGEYLDSFNEELSRDEPRKSILKAMWDGLVAVLPYVASTATIATGIGNLIG